MCSGQKCDKCYKKILDRNWSDTLSISDGAFSQSASCYSAAHAAQRGPGDTGINPGHWEFFKLDKKVSLKR